jgi:hypothetical protein
MNDDKKKNMKSTFGAKKQNNNQVLHDQISDIINQEETDHATEAQAARKRSKEKRERPFMVFGVLCIVLCLVVLIFSNTSSIDTSDAAKDALANQVSTTLSTGTILLNEDEELDQQDYTITHNSDEGEAKIWIWDYAAEDGDYVQVLVNGTPVSDAFMIKHKPVEFTVPATGIIQIKGIKDGVGGISYAVKYDLNYTTYFNIAPLGEFNTYTLIKE